MQYYEVARFGYEIQCNTNERDDAEQMINFEISFLAHVCMSILGHRWRQNFCQIFCEPRFCKLKGKTENFAIFLQFLQSG